MELKEFSLDNGSIHLICGPMFSGKSSELMKRVRRLQHMNLKVLVINYCKDDRYSQESVIATHDKITYSAQKCEHIKDILNIYQDYDVFAIDEGQFFSDLNEMSEFLANQKKKVIIAFLDATFQRQAFGNVIDLLPKSETITKLTAVCAHCKQSASFSRRKTNQTQVELIGNDIYEPVCRKCFNLLEKQKQEENPEII